MNILFVGTFVSDEIEHKEPNISAAGNRFQNNFVKNAERAGNNVEKASYLGMPLSEKYDLPGDEYVLRSEGLYKAVRRFKSLIKSKIKGCDAVICYNIVYAWLFLPFWARKNKKKSIVILADYSEEDCYKSFARKIYVKLQRLSMRKFDVVIGLSKNIEKQLRSNQKFVHLEGGIDRELFNRFTDCPNITDGALKVMYSGLLEPVTGVDKLLEDIKKIPAEANVEFWFTGKGSLSESISEASKEDERIKLLGNLEYEKYIERLKLANVLINPRNMKLPENRNNFPSKIMDYLATGKNIVSTRFAGWEKFSDVIIFYDDLASEFEQILGRLSTECDTASKNRKFAEQFIWDNEIKRFISE